MAERVLTEVCLRDVEDADLAWFYEHQADEAAAQLVGFKTREPDAFAAHWAKSRADESVLLRTVLADGSVAGHVVSWEQGGTRVVGYWLGREHWGRGIATRALALFLDEVPRRPLQARVSAGNAASIRVLEKCRFRRDPDALPASSGSDGIVDLVFVLDD